VIPFLVSIRGKRKIEVSIYRCIRQSGWQGFDRYSVFAVSLSSTSIFRRFGTNINQQQALEISFVEIPLALIFEGVGDWAGGPTRVGISGSTGKHACVIRKQTCRRDPGDKYSISQETSAPKKTVTHPQP